MLQVQKKLNMLQSINFPSSSVHPTHTVHSAYPTNEPTNSKYSQTYNNEFLLCSDKILDEKNITYPRSLKILGTSSSNFLTDSSYDGHRKP